MEHSHLTAEALRKLLDRDRGEEETRLLLHQLAVCPACYAVGGFVLDLYRTGAIGLAFCSVDVELARSRAVAPALFAKLARFSFEQQQGLVRDTRQFRSVGLCELLCRESERAAATDAARAVDLAELAVLVASLLEEPPLEATWLDQVRAHAWAHLANARRALGELRGADHAFRQAEGLWATATREAGDSLGYEAHYLLLKAALRREEHLLMEALALLDQALAAEGGPALRGVILVHKALVCEELGDRDRAGALLRESEGYLATSPR